MARTRSAPTIHDVASAAGVSVTTVSRVLNAKGDVAEATALRVRGVIDALNYESSMAARSMRSSSTHVIGLIMPDMDHSYGVEIIKATSRAITDSKYDLIALTSGSKSHVDRARWEQQQVRRLNGTITDGVIIVVPDATEFSTDYPLVAIDPMAGATNFPSVSGDNLAGGRAAMEHLLGLGHTRIGYIDGVAHLESATSRRKAYLDALRAAGLPVNPDYMQPGDFLRNSGVLALRAFAALPEPPTAVFAGNDDTSFGLMEEAHALGIDIPGSLSVVGYDNVPEAAFTRPGLTTIDQEIGQMVKTAMQMLLELIAGHPLAQDRVKTSTRLIVRDSCAPPSRPGRSTQGARQGSRGGSARLKGGALVQP